MPRGSLALHCGKMGEEGQRARTFWRPLDTLLRTTVVGQSVSGQHHWSIRAHRDIGLKDSVVRSQTRFRAASWQDKATLNEFGNVGEGFATPARERSAPEVEEKCIPTI